MQSLPSEQRLDYVSLLSVYGVLSLPSGREWISAGHRTVLKHPRAHDLSYRYVGFFVSFPVPPVACEPSCGDVMKGYPIFLIGLAEKRCVVVGGGSEAERKVTGLLECDAAVTVISAELTPQLRLWAEAGTITWISRSYQCGDLPGVHLAIVTDSSPSMRAAICHEAETERVLLNVVDDTSHSNFTAGAVVRQGALTIAISTSGCAPALAVRLRQQLERTFGPEYALFLDWLRAVRAPLAARYPNFSERRARWYALVDSEILSWLQQGRVDLARQRMAEIIADATVDTAESTPDTW